MKISPNTIVRFHANYIDDDKKPVKERRYLIISIKQEKLLLLKVTSKFKSLIHQRFVGSNKCLDRPSYANLNRKISFDLVSLEKNNYQKFYFCGYHTDGCVDKKRFERIKVKLMKYWENKLNRDKEELFLDWNSLKSIKINSKGCYFY